MAGKDGDGAVVDVGAAEYQPPAPVTTPAPTATPTPVLNQINVPADYSTIQGAIDAAGDGETIMVAPGRYFEALNFEGKSITVAGVTDSCDRHRCARLRTAIRFSSGEDTDSVLSGFRYSGSAGRGFRRRRLDYERIADHSIEHHQ